MNHLQIYVKETAGKFHAMVHYDYDGMVSEIQLEDADGNALIFDTEVEANEYITSHPHREGSQLFTCREEILV